MSANTLRNQIIVFSSLAKTGVASDIIALAQRHGARIDRELSSDVSFIVLTGLFQGRAKNTKPFWQAIDAGTPMVDESDFYQIIEGKMTIDEAINRGDAYRPQPDPPSTPDLFSQRIPIEIQSTDAYCV